MTDAEQLYHQITAELPDAKASKMFGALCIKAPNGKAAAMFYKDEMVFKLEGEAQQDALSLDGAHVFDPMGGRPMNGWIQLPFAYASRWPEFAAKAMDYVRRLEK